MIETEVKIRPFSGKEYIKRALEKINATYLYTVEEHDTYYQHPVRDFSRTDEALRLREIRKGNTVECVITYKGPREEGVFKKREEVEVRVSSCVDMDYLLKKLGFKDVAVIKKKREYYKLGRCLISLDYVEKLGFFVEIECSEEEIKNVIDMLKINYEVVEETYLEMILRNKNK